MLNDNANRRKRRRRPTFTTRFGPNSLALEIGIVRLALLSGALGEGGVDTSGTCAFTRRSDKDPQSR